MKGPKPVIKDQYTTAQVYFGCLIGLILIESMLVLPQYLMAVFRKAYVKKPAKHNKLSVIFHKLATLPSPVPFLTAHNYPTYIRFLVFVALNILFGYNRVKFTTDFKLYGWLTLSNAGMTLLLSPRGCNLLSLVLRVPSVVLLTYHRWCGMACMVHATLHFVLTIEHNGRTGQLKTAFTNDIYQAGLVAWIALALVYFTSLRFVRRLCWEMFYYPHYFFLVFSVAAMYHAPHAKEFFLPGLGLWLVDRVWRMKSWVKKVQVSSVEHLEGDVTKITVADVKSSAAGQIAWVQFPDISGVRWHPFTIASAPGGEGVTFAMRGLGGYTKMIQRLEAGYDEKISGVETQHHQQQQQRQQLAMKIDGPHGVGGIKWGQHAVTVLIAGGIGITPGISIAGDIINSTMSTTSPYSSPSAACRHVHLLWIIKDISHVNWFASELSTLASIAASSDGKVTFDLTIHYTTNSSSVAVMGRKSSPSTEYTSSYPHSSSDDNNNNNNRADRVAQEEALISGHLVNPYHGPGDLIQGRPDILAWFQNVRDRRRGMDVAVSLCGPRRMIDTARKAAANVSSESGLFEVEEEVFEF